MSPLILLLTIFVISFEAWIVDVSVLTYDDPRFVTYDERQ